MTEPIEKKYPDVMEDDNTEIHSKIDNLKILFLYFKEETVLWILKIIVRKSMICRK